MGNEFFAGKFPELLGKPPEEAVLELKKQNLNFCVVYTKDFKTSGEVQERVIRLREKNSVCEVLVGFFQAPAFK